MDPVDIGLLLFSKSCFNLHSYCNKHNFASKGRQLVPIEFW